VKKSIDTENAITHGVIWEQLLLFFFPLLFGMFFQQLYNTADAIIVGRFVGKQALSAVGGSTGTLINFFVGFFTGVSSGATVTIARYYGAEKPDSVKKALHTSIAIAVAGGLIFTVLGLWSAPLIVRWMGAPEDTVEGSVLYLRIYFSGMTANLVYNMGAGILRAVGDSKRPLYFLIISCFSNIFLDLLFVVVFHMGVGGAALATILCQLLSAVLVLAALAGSRDMYRLTFREIRMDGGMFGRIMAIGIPVGFESVMYSFSNIVIQSSINSFGTDTVAAWSAYGKIDGTFWIVMNSFGIAITTFVGQNSGAGLMKRVKDSIVQCFIVATAFTAALSFLLYFFGPYLLHLFTTDTEVIAIGTQMMHFLVPVYFTFICIEILSGSLRGLGNSLVPAIITCAGVCGLRILWIFFAVPQNPTIENVMTSYPLTWVVTSLIFVAYFFAYTKKKRYFRTAAADG